MDIRELTDRLISVFFPQRCVLCGDVVAYDDYWCGKCAFGSGGVIETQSPLESAAAPAEYGGNVQKAILTIKKRPDARTIKFFAEQMYKIIHSKWDTVFDVIIPIPINGQRLEARGFNQAELLAEALGVLMGVEVCAGALQRRDGMDAQHDLSARDRMENAIKSYEIKSADRIKGKRVLLVDDVYTTGATMRACARLLKSAGASAIYGIAAAHTVLKKDRK